jgi:hypothetical protein
MVELIRPLSRTATILPEPEDVVLVIVPERPVKVEPNSFTFCTTNLENLVLCTRISNPFSSDVFRSGFTLPR